MAAPSDTVWELEPHTAAKHEILRRYLQAWMPILSRGGFPQILYIDGFAGPGKYKNGEDGSPIIALKAALGFQPSLSAQIDFLFIEKDPARAQFLEKTIAALNLPRNFRTKVFSGETFEAVFDREYSSLLNAKGQLPPTFAFIDPFGWKGVPFEITQRIMAHQNCEVLINFMYEEINRFLSHQDQIQNYDIFFGGNEWAECKKIIEPRQRHDFIRDLYSGLLERRAGIRFVRTFEMLNKSNTTDYFLFYGTNNLLGLQKMKEAMWRVDELGDFTFSDATDPNQLVMFEREPNFRHLRRQITDEFRGQEVSVGAIKEFVLVHTAFRETHYKSKILRLMESEEQLRVVDPPPKRRKGTFSPDSLRIKFSPTAV